MKYNWQNLWQLYICICTLNNELQFNCLFLIYILDEFISSYIITFSSYIITFFLLTKATLTVSKQRTRPRFLFSTFERKFFIKVWWEVIWAWSFSRKGASTQTLRCYQERRSPGLITSFVKAEEQKSGLVQCFHSKNNTTYVKKKMLLKLCFVS